MIWRKLFYSKIFFLFLLICLIFLLIILYKNWLKNRVFEIKLFNLKTKLASLEEENKVLEEKLKSLEDWEAKEKLARQLYPLKKPGEQVVIVPSEFLATPSPSSTNFSSFFLEKFFEKIKNWFKF